MTNKEAIEILTKEKYPHPLSDYEHELTEALDLAIKALEQTEVKGDLISREWVTKKLEEMANDEWNIQVGSSKGLEDAIDVIDNAPTVEPTFREQDDNEYDLAMQNVTDAMREEAEND